MAQRLAIYGVNVSMRRKEYQGKRASSGDFAAFPRESVGGSPRFACFIDQGRETPMPGEGATVLVNGALSGICPAHLHTVPSVRRRMRG